MLAFHTLRGPAGTELHFDFRTQAVRLDPPAEAFRNLVLATIGRRGWLLVLGYYPAAFAVLSFQDGRWRLNPPDLLDQHAVLVDHLGPELVAIRREHLFLGVSSRGWVEFDRPSCQSGEMFRMALALRLPASPDPVAPPEQETAPTDPFISIAGAFNSTWSLAAVNRRIASLLHRRAPDAVAIVASDAPLWGDCAAEQAILGDLLGRPAPPDRPHVVIHQRWPVTPPEPQGDISAAMFFWEESRVPSDVVATLNRFDLVLAPTRFVETALLTSGLTTRMIVSGFGPDLSGFAELHRLRRDRPRDGRPLTFLHVSSCALHKGVDVLLEAFCRRFRARDHVRLIVKGHPNESNQVEHRIAGRRHSDADMPDIVYIGDLLVRDAMVRLYGEADVMVLPTRGEGFNLPAAEAIAAGLGLIVTGHGGHMDFCGPEVARLLAFTLRPSPLKLLEGDSLWADPDPDDLVLALGEAFEGRLPKGEAGRDSVLRALDGAAWSDRLVAALRQLAASRKADAG